MLVELDEEIEALPIDGGGTDAAIYALENLATARREGKHLIVGKGTTLNSLADWEKLSTRCRGTLRQAASRATEEMGLARHLALRVVVSSSATTPSVSGLQDHQVITLPLSFFSDSRSVQPSRVLVENLVDADLYISLGEYFGKESGLQGISVVLEPLHGGGSTTASVYANEQRVAKAFCICIVDSDRDCPSDALGSTARAVLKSEDAGKPYTAVHIPDLRTAENLIPYGVLEGIAYNNIPARSGPIPTRQNVAHLIQKLAHSTSPEVRLWIPLKLSDPVLFNRILGMATAEGTKAYWCDWARVIGSACGVSSTCKQQNRCRRTEECTCEVLPTAKGLLEDAVDFMQKQSTQKLSEYVASDSTLKTEWMRIGLVTFSWGCSKKPLRT